MWMRPDRRTYDRSPLPHVPEGAQGCAVCISPISAFARFPSRRRALRFRAARAADGSRHARRRCISKTKTLSPTPHDSLSDSHCVMACAVVIRSRVVERRHAGELLALEELERRTAASGDVRHRWAKLHLLHGRHRITTTHDRDGAVLGRLREAIGDGERARGEGLHLEHTLRRRRRDMGCGVGVREDKDRCGGCTRGNRKR